MAEKEVNLSDRVAEVGDGVCEVLETAESDVTIPSLNNMQRRKCCYKMCLENMICKKGPFHSFPKGEKNQERRLKWMQNSGNEDLLSLSLASLDSKFVCGGHFSSDSYSNKQISRLKANALPTENLLDVFTDEVMLGVLGHDECLRNVNVVSASSGCSVSCSSRVESNYVSLITPNDDVIGVVRKNIWRSCCFVGCESDGSHRVLHQFPKLYCNGQVDMVNVEK
ncbi:uncharacterized protein LOC127749938 [Frankliniella occidentalis]|uniref:Uncharacterized protein LOC127749938 n=1 Tax=Frankliniella occidentalis TaxID=133901 RepID=A0A9C6UEL9_FRAOC|nr:uncharacterized protein LOC127749938 [Frankliniella occidentalis]